MTNLLFVSATTTLTWIEMYLNEDSCSTGFSIELWMNIYFCFSQKSYVWIYLL